jgi:hypothetical protein
MSDAADASEPSPAEDAASPDEGPRGPYGVDRPPPLTGVAGEDRLPPLPEPELDEPPAWPWHQRALGAGVRGALAYAGGIPLAVYILIEEFHRFDAEWIWGNAVALVCAVVLFLWERRGVRWWSTALRLAGAGATAAVVGPITFVWLDNLGDPARAYSLMARLARPDRLMALVGFMLGAAIVVPLLGAWVYLRARTQRLVPQVLAGGLTLAVPSVILLGASEGDAVVIGLLLLVTSGLVPLGGWFGDRYAERFDPAAPVPRRPVDMRLALCLALTPAWALSGLFAVSVTNIRIYDHHAHPRYQLRELALAQQTFHEEEGVFAGNLAQLAGLEGGRLDSDAGVARGLEGGYVFRMIRGRLSPSTTWAVAADPAGEGPDAKQFFIINHAGRVRSSWEPIPFDPDWCELPDEDDE